MACLELLSHSQSLRSWRAKKWRARVQHRCPGACPRLAGRKRFPLL